jgi:hypothetical protein
MGIYSECQEEAVDEAYARGLRDAILPHRFRQLAYELVEADIRRCFQRTHFEVHDKLNDYLEAECIEVPETTTLMQSVDVVLGYLDEQKRKESLK